MHLVHVIINFAVVVYKKVYFMCREHHTFVLLCLKLLCTHLSLAVTGGVVSTMLGKQARPLRNLLFRLVDTETPHLVKQVSALTFRIFFHIRHFDLPLIPPPPTVVIPWYRL